jgi:hypothetical protein
MTTIDFSIGIVKPITTRYGIRAPKGGCTVTGRTFKGGQFCYPFDASNPHSQPIAAPAPVVVPAASPTPFKVAINGFTYTVREIDPGECGTVAFRMHRIDTNNTYDVIRNHFGEVTCDCPDYEMRRAGTGQICKHGSRLVELGMIPAPSHSVRQVEPEAPFDGRALWAYARDRRAIPAVIAFGRANDYPRMVVQWSVEQATAAYYEIVEAVEGMVIQ